MITRTIRINPRDMTLSRRDGRRKEFHRPHDLRKAYPAGWFQRRNQFRRAGDSEAVFRTAGSLARLQLQRRRVDAIAQPRRARAVVEDMAEVARAVRAQDFGPHHAVTMVGLFVDMTLHRWLREARPAAAGIELGVGLEQRLPATGADICAGALLMLVFARERPLGRLFAQDRVLHWRQFLAPLGLALFDFAWCRLGVSHRTSIPGARGPLNPHVSCERSNH